MSMLLWVIIITAIAGVVGTGLGGVIGAMFKKDSSPVVSLLLSFAGGVMLAVVCFDLMENAIHQEGISAQSALWLSITGMVVGFALVYILNHLIDRSTNHEVPHQQTGHPQTADDLDELIHADHYEEHKKNHNSLFMAGVVMAVAIALHNLPEGMVIGASYVSADGVLLSGSGLIIAIIIGLHNIPEGMAVSVPLIAGGMSRIKAVLVTAASGAPTIIGAILGYCLGTMGAVGLSLSLSFAGGAMLYVVLGELLPEAILMWKSKFPAFATFIGIIVGIIIIYV